MLKKLKILKWAIAILFWVLSWWVYGWQFPWLVFLGMYANNLSLYLGGQLGSSREQQIDILKKLIKMSRR